MDLILAIQKDRSVRQLELDARAAKSLSGTLKTFADLYLDNVELHEYAPAFHPEAGGRVVVKFTLPEALQKCAKATPSNLASLKPDQAAVTPPVALVGVEQGSTPRFVFQAVNASMMLKKGRVILFNPDGFTVNAQPGIAIRGRVDAVHLGGKLYFTSEQVVRRFLDIDYLFREATDDEIEQLFKRTAFAVDDWTELKDAANSVLRRKLHIVLSSGRKIVPTDVKALAKRIGETVEVRKGALVVPTEPAAFREFVRLLAHDYLESPLDRELYLATSKRPVKPPK